MGAYANAAISFPLLGNWSICPSNHFTLFGHTFYWYGVIVACGFLLAVSYCYRRCERDFGIRQDDLTDTLLFAVPLGIIGARIYYIIFFGNYHTLAEMVKIWEGGLAIYGGIIVGFATLYVVCRVKKISPLAMMDIVSFGFFIGQAVGRWGNFMNREAFGYETDAFCRMGLTLNGTTIYVHPTFLYESLWNCVGFIAMHIYSKKRERKFDGQYFLMYLFWYGLGRTWIESMRTDSLYIGTSGIRVSQLLAAVTCLVSAGIILAVIRSGRCSPEKLWVHRAALNAAENETAPEEDADASSISDEETVLREDTDASATPDKEAAAGEDTDASAAPDEDA